LAKKNARAESGTGALSRARRVGAERVFEPARHLTDRDREVALSLYDQQLLTTDRHAAVLEAGAHLVAASLNLDRRYLPWQRREDWRSHPQLAHRLAVNSFVTDLIAATLDDPKLGVTSWFGTRAAAARLGERMRGAVRPDGELILLTSAGPVDLLLEWDRGDRLPREKIEQAVIRQLASIYRDEHVISDAIAKANADAVKRRPEFEQRLASIGAEITRAEQALERYYEAFEQRHALTAGLGGRFRGA
jgi:Replication-relaxation